MEEKEGGEEQGAEVECGQGEEPGSPDLEQLIFPCSTLYITLQYTLQSTLPYITLYITLQYTLHYPTLQYILPCSTLHITL